MTHYKLAIIILSACLFLSPLTAQSTTPVLRDIPLPLPLPEPVLIFLLIFSFLLHILFVNLMLGGALIGLWAEIKGKKEAAYDTLAYQIASTVTVNKSLAVVLGVAPLLSINVLYPLFFYSANILTGNLWISLVPLVSLAFLLLYYHKYSWEKFTAQNKNRHILISILAILLLLFIPLIFLTNINLMLFPERWGQIRGFFSALWLPNVLFRYFHFLCATLAITGLFLFWFMNRKPYDFATIFQNTNLSKTEVLKKWYKLALFASLLQLLLGPLNLFTLPWHGVTWTMVILLIIGLIFALGAILMLRKDLQPDNKRLGRLFIPILLSLTITVACMGTARHLYRSTAINSHPLSSHPLPPPTATTAR